MIDETETARGALVCGCVGVGGWFEGAWRSVKLKFCTRGALRDSLGVCFACKCWHLHIKP